MSQPSHLRPVTSTSDGGNSPTAAGRGPQRQRAARALPTDRLKVDRQIAVLRTLGRLSGPRKDARNAHDVAKAAGGVSDATVFLSNKFFVDAGWIVAAGKGLYAATDALVEYGRRVTTGAADPAEVLRTPARESWFWQALEPHLADGPLAANEAEILLIRAADATETHMPMIRNLIAWMEYVGLISVQNGTIMAKDESPITGNQPGAAQPPAETEVPAETGTPGTEPTDQGESLPAPVVMFGLDVRLTVDDLAALSPEQIKAFFEAVGTLAALRRTK